MSDQRLLIAGCGDLGMRVAQRLGQATIYGLRRSIGALPPNVQGIEADLISGRGYAALPSDIDTVIYAATPATRDENGYRAIYVDALERLLHALPQPHPGLRLIYVSSSAVYGQNAGEWVDEHSTAAATTFNGSVLLEAERRGRALVSTHVSVRLSGLYGPGRMWLVNRVRTLQAIAAGAHYGNRIHIDDAAALVARMATAEQVPPCIIGVDDEPAPMSLVLDWIANALGLPQLPRTGNAEDVTGKRLRNDLSHAIGWRPRYASFRDGYTDVLTSLRPCA